MALTSQRSFFFYAPGTVVIATVGGILFIYINGVIFDRVRDAASVTFQIVAFFKACYVLFLFVLLFHNAVYLFKRRWFSVLYGFTALCIGFTSILVSLALRDDRFMFVAKSHDEIAGIYDQRRSEFDPHDLTPRLIPLDNQCRPPNGCECWLVVDPAHSSGVENENGGWHRPTASIFPTNTAPEHFAIVNVKRLDSGAYSVLGCDVDPTTWWLR